MSATTRLLSGNRLHLQHGPIDLVIGADGEAAEIERAYRAAWAEFSEILPALVAELSFLRARVANLPLSPDFPGERAEAGRARPAEGEGRPLAPMQAATDWLGATGAAHFAAPLPNPLPRNGGGEGTVARLMHAAVWPYRDRFITPMAAVAGSVADHVLRVMLEAADLRRAYVNNGGDIAFHLGEGATFIAGVVGDLSAPGIHARVTIHEGIGGIATSGWRGRSQSLGIADSVTVLAATASHADAAATMIANAVDVNDAAIERRPAREVKDDSDLGDIPVTVGVGALVPLQRARALEAGRRRALEILRQNLIVAAYIQLQGDTAIVGADARLTEAA